MVLVTLGVPQGIVLGPALFTLFINDIVEVVSGSKIRLSADDTIIYTTMTQPSDMEILQQDLAHVAQWASQNEMRFNVDKSLFMKFGKSQNFSYIGMMLTATL